MRKNTIVVLLLLCVKFAFAQDEALFVCSNNQQLTDFKLLHHVFAKSALPKDTTLFGKLVKQGKSSVFYLFRAQRSGIEKVRIEIDPYAFKLDDGEHWGFLTTRLSDKEFEKSKATAFQLVGNVAQIEQMSRQFCTKWFDENRKTFDSNQFKKTKRYQTALTHLADLDFNAQPFQELSKVTFIDMATGLIGLNMGEQQLHKTEQRSDKLTYHLIYNFRHKEVQQVFVHNTGYFLE